MKASPRRPLILKRRKLPFHRDEADGPRRDAPPPPGVQTFLDGVRVVDHPALSDTQVVVIPKTADLQSVIGALTAKGKERGAQGPNKFILLSGSAGMEHGDHALIGSTSGTPSGTLAAKLEHAPAAEDVTESKAPLIKKPLKAEAECGPLDESLTNVQWLRKTSPCSDEASGKEPPADGAPHQQPGLTEETTLPKDLQSERPPYSYMAMIQFAINSSGTRKMTLKEIYTWIEEHFPFFRTVAKPGWKNSIRHNLSLHDMFVRETTSDGKVSYWTIKPEANRCLTLDQVYKPAIEPAPPSYLQTMQVCFQQQKRVNPDVRKVTAPTSERKMKHILPRTDSYLVPIQLPLTPSLFLPSTTALSLPAPQQVSNPSSGVGGKRVRIAPMVLPSDSCSARGVCTPTTKVKEESVYAPVTSKPCSRKRKETSGSRRKQRLFPPSVEEPVLLFPDSTFFDSGVASDASTMHEQEPEAQVECDTFKTPIKSSHPASSTPSKAAEPWRVTPLGKGSHAVLDFSPIRTPQRPELCGLSFSSTPFKELPLFSSPRELLTSCPREAGSAVANHSFTEGLVLDTLNDSLSKILVDISFSGLEDEDLGIANISWSQFIPELK